MSWTFDPRNTGKVGRPLHGLLDADTGRPVGVYVEATNFRTDDPEDLARRVARLPDLEAAVDPLPHLLEVVPQSAVSGVPCTQEPRVWSFPYHEQGCYFRVKAYQVGNELYWGLYYRPMSQDGTMVGEPWSKVTVLEPSTVLFIYRATGILFVPNVQEGTL